MGFLSGLGAALGAINPVGLVANAGEFAGSILGAIGQNATNQANRDIASGANATSSAIAQANMAMEYDFAKNGISWRIADAAKNGISPLAALGASEPSASPVSQQVFTPSFQSPIGNIAEGVSRVGQNVSRALLATKTPEERTSEALQLARQAKENDLLDVQIANAKLALAAHSAPPGIPLAYRSVMNADGTTSLVPTAEANTHGEFLGPLRWSFENKLIPGLQAVGNHLLQAGENDRIEDSDIQLRRN